MKLPYQIFLPLLQYLKTQILKKCLYIFKFKNKMNIFRKVFHPKHKNEISFKANAYVKARNICIGVLEPNETNLLIKFCPENLEKVYGPYKIFTDILQENEDNFVFLIGLLKNGTLVHLNLKNVENNGDDNSNSLQFSSLYDNGINHNTSEQKNSLNTLTFWERLSKPRARILEDLNKRKTSNIQSEELVLTIDGNFVRQRMIKKNKKYNGQTIIKILNDKNVQVSKIPWKYYTVSDTYLKGPRTYSIDEDNSMCSQDYAESTHISCHMTTEEEKEGAPNSNLASEDYLNTCLNDMNKVMTGFMQELSPIDKKCSEININSELSFTKPSDESLVRNIVATTSSQDAEEILNLNQEDSHCIIEKSDIQITTATKALKELNDENLATKQENSSSENLTESKNIETGEILISKPKSDTSENIKIDENLENDGELINQSTNQTLYVFTESPHLSEQEDSDTSQQNLHKVYENISDKKMEEIIVSLIRNANMPVSIDILTKIHTLPDKSTLNLNYQQNELLNAEELSYSVQPVLDIEIERLTSNEQERALDLSLPPATNIKQNDSILNTENTSCGVQPMQDINIKRLKNDQQQETDLSLPAINDPKYHDSDETLSSIDMEYLDVILNSICDSCENMSLNISLSESSKHSVTSDTFVKDTWNEEMFVEPSNHEDNKLQIEKVVNMITDKISKQQDSEVDFEHDEIDESDSHISCQNYILDGTYVLSPKSLSSLPISIIERTEDIAKLAEELVKRFQLDETLSTTEINEKISAALSKNICDLTKSSSEYDNTLYITANEGNKSSDTTIIVSDFNIPLADMISMTTSDQTTKTHEENWTQTETFDIVDNDVDEKEDNSEDILKDNLMSGDFQTVFNSVAVPKEWDTVLSIPNSGENLLPISKYVENVRESLNICDIVERSEKLLESVKEDINKPSLGPPWWIRLSLPENSKKCKSVGDETYRIKIAQSHASTSQRSRRSDRSSYSSYRVLPKPTSDREKERQEVEEAVIQKIPRSKFIVSDRLIRLSQPKVRRSPKSKISKVSKK